MFNFTWKDSLKSPNLTVVLLFPVLSCFVLKILHKKMINLIHNWIGGGESSKEQKQPKLQTGPLLCFWDGLALPNGTIALCCEKLL